MKALKDWESFCWHIICFRYQATVSYFKTLNFRPIIWILKSNNRISGLFIFYLLSPTHFLERSVMIYKIVSIASYVALKWKVAGIGRAQTGSYWQLQKLRIVLFIPGDTWLHLLWYIPQTGFREFVPHCDLEIILRKQCRKSWRLSYLSCRIFVIFCADRKIFHKSSACTPY